MGRPFATELTNLSQTIRVVNTQNLKDLPRQIKLARLRPAFLIGTGGSLTAAEFAKRLFDQCGVIAQAVTPLEFIQSHASLRHTSIFIFSAGGNNKDILASFQAAYHREAAQVVIICASLNTRLARMAANCERAFSFEFALPSGRDGYLATNSLVATCVLLTRAFEQPTLAYDKVETLLEQGRQAFTATYNKAKANHYVVLFSSWGRPAAIDLESKLSEAGLFASMLADYRHFAHGRHNWLDKHGQDTTVVAFSTPEDERLAKATLARIPSLIPSCRLHTTTTGCVGGLELLLMTFGFIAAAGDAANIDPGRPGVPTYGSEIYQLGPRVTVNKSPSDKQTLSLSAGVDRKLAAVGTFENSRAFFYENGRRFLDRLYTTSFGALVVDFDGTILPVSARTGPIPKAIKNALSRLLKASVPVYFATGRGDSVHQVLTESFPRKFWRLLHVGYFNGAFCLPLSEATKYSKQRKRFSELDRFETYLRNNPIHEQLAKIKNKRCQISLFPIGDVNTQTIITAVQEEIAKLRECSIRMVISSHSIDLIPRNVSKITCLRHAEHTMKGRSKTLALGDCGAYPGNDFELLQHPFSLSVDAVSADLNSCWNFLPTGLSHTNGTAFYLSRLVVEKGTFKFKS
jgi:HAD superfamily hydrolase (TIGR01484 family)